MKLMTIERSLEVKGILAAEQIRLQCQMKYQNEEDGKRAFGNIYVRGIYFDGEKKRPLREIVVLDIFAPKYKLLDDEEFLVEINDSHYDIKNQMLLLTIDIQVNGICADDDPIELFPMDAEAVTNEANEYYEHKELPIHIVEEVTNEIGGLTKQEDEVIEEDLLYQKEVKATYRMILLKENSSYEIVAAQYGVNLQKLRLLNCDKPLMAKMLVLLPENDS